ncbi:MAG TPA: hypothetical protein VJ987_03665 [Anaerolineales bacterium]|nr:hypothetical protein [Anaerolineales bacterium]
MRRRKSPGAGTIVLRGDLEVKHRVDYTLLGNGYKRNPSNKTSGLAMPKQYIYQSEISIINEKRRYNTCRQCPLINVKILKEAKNV